MLIRTQNKKGIVNLNNVDSIDVCIISKPKEIKENYETKIKYYNGAIETAGCLGTYSSEEKAIKVLDMIEDVYNKCFAFDMGNDGYYHEVRESKVFQMPQDSEV